MKLTHLSLAVMVALGLAACGGSSTDHTKTPPKKEEPKKEDPKKEEPKKDKVQDPTKLDVVVGFDMTKVSSTGSTQAIRQKNANFNRTANPDVNKPAQAASIISLKPAERLNNAVLAQLAKGSKYTIWVDADGKATHVKPKDTTGYTVEHIKAFYAGAQPDDVVNHSRSLQRHNKALPIQFINKNDGNKLANVNRAIFHPSATSVLNAKRDDDGKITGYTRSQPLGNGTAAANWNILSDYANYGKLAPLWINQHGKVIASEDVIKSQDYADDGTPSETAVRIYGHKSYVYNNGDSLGANSYTGATPVAVQLKDQYQVDGKGNFVGSKATIDALAKAEKALADAKKGNDLGKIKAANDALTAAQDANKKAAMMTENVYSLKLNPVKLEHVQYGRVTARLGAGKGGLASDPYFLERGNWLARFQLAGKESKESVDTYFYRGYNPTTVAEMAKLKGKLTYNGHALMYGIENGYGQTGDVPFAVGAKPGYGVGHLVTATYDVAKQNVSGKVYNAWLLDTTKGKVEPDDLVKFSGKVTGNSVLGEAELVKNSKAAKADFRGSFFGSAANELGGSFNSVRTDAVYGPRGWGGVFGAKRGEAPAAGVDLAPLSETRGQQ